MVVAIVVLVVVLALLGAGLAVGLRSRRHLAVAPGHAGIDPFAIGEPWRHVVIAALRSRQQAARAVASSPPGPLHDRLHAIEQGLDDALEQCWAIARRGHELRRAITAMDLDGARSRLDVLAPRLPAPAPPLPSADPPADPAAAGDDLVAQARALDAGTPEAAAARTADALQAKLAAGARLRDATSQAEGTLRLLGARLDEASARIIELAARPGDATTELGSLGGDVDSLVLELEAVRQGLEAVGPGPSA